MGEGRAPFPPKLLQANLDGSEKLFLDPAVLIVGAKGLYFVCPIRALQHNGPQSHWGGFQFGSNALALKKSRRKKKKKSDGRPPPLIICGAGVTRAGATGAYKDLCAGKGIRLQARNEWGRSALVPCAPAICNGGGWVSQRPPGSRKAGLEGRSFAGQGLGTFTRSGKTDI